MDSTTGERNLSRREPEVSEVKSTATGALVFACLSAAGLLGMRLRAALPQHHLSADTKDAVRIGMGLVATMAALVLGLLVASTKGAYDNEKSEVTQMAAKIIFLDRVLANYGKETANTRDLLLRSVESAVMRMWPDLKSSRPVQLDPSVSSGEALFNSIQQLTPQDEAQRALKSQAVQLATDIGQMRWLLFEQTGTSISIPLLIIVILWLATIFVSVGVFAPSNSTVIAALLLAALSVSGAIFLILELDRPFNGIIKISVEPMRAALNHLAH
jgi:hypothetical protein